jgi:hypothetical protein
MSRVRRVPSPTSLVAEPGLLPPLVRDPTEGAPNIQRAIARLEHMPDFPAFQIPSPDFNPSVHAAMSSLIAQRDQVQADLVILHDQDAVHSLPNYDDEYLLSPPTPRLQVKPIRDLCALLKPSV